MVYSYDVDFSYGKVPTDNPIENKNAIEQLIEIINDFLDKYTELAVIIFALLTVALVFVMMFNFSSLGASSNSPIERKKALAKVLLSGISASLMGALGLFIAISYNLF